MKRATFLSTLLAGGTLGAATLAAMIKHELGYMPQQLDRKSVV